MYPQCFPITTILLFQNDAKNTNRIQDSYTNNDDNDSSILSNLRIVSHLIFTTLWGKLYHYANFTDEEIKTQRC